MVQGTKTFRARLCYNSKCWTTATGEARKLEAASQTWVAQHGIGHEEWLFRRGWTIDGWRYGWIQGVQNSRKIKCGDVVDVHLFTIPPERGRLWVGRIRAVEILVGGPDAREAEQVYRKRGWLALMRSETREVHADSRSFDVGFINVRFRPESVEINQLPYPQAHRADPIHRCNYYDLYETKNSAGPGPGQPGGVVHKNLRRRHRPATEAADYDPVHDMLQLAVYEQLVSRFGRGSVHMEADHVDITVRNRQRNALLEVKSDPCARLAIRSALGQLLEYGFRLGRLDAELHVVSPGTLTPDDQHMIDSFRQAFRLLVRYHRFCSAEDRVTL